MSTTAPPLDERWNLSDIYESPEAFEKSKQEFRETLLPPIDRFRGRLLSSARELADALDAAYGARKQLQILQCYASVKSDEDTRVAADQARRLEAQLLATELSKRVAYLRPEILAGDPETLEGYLENEPRLAPYRHFLQDLLRQRSHVLEPGEERILAESGLLRGQASSTYQLLSHAELPRPEIELDDGRTVRLTSVAFHKHRTTRHRPDRMKMFPAYFSAYSDFRDTLGNNVYAGVKEHLFVAQAALRKVRSKTLDDGSAAHSFQTLLKVLSSIVRNICHVPGAGPDDPTFEVVTTPSAKQQRAYDLLGTIEV